MPDDERGVSPEPGSEDCESSLIGRCGSVSVWVGVLPGLTQLHRLTSSDCLDNDPSARLGHPPDTHRSDGVTY